MVLTASSGNALMISFTSKKLNTLYLCVRCAPDRRLHLDDVVSFKVIQRNSLNRFSTIGDQSPATKNLQPRTCAFTVHERKDRADSRITGLISQMKPYRL